MPDTEGAILSAIENLETHQRDGFKAVHDRLDRMNGRVRKNAGEIIRLQATAVTTKSCDKIRRTCDRVRAAHDRARGAGWRTFAIASGSGIVVALATAIILTAMNGSG